MIIVKTTNGDCFINETETLQVSHVKDKAQVEVWPSRWGNQQQQPQYYVIENVEQVIYTTSQTAAYTDVGSELDKYKKELEAQIDSYNKLKHEYLNLMQERDELEERLEKLQPKHQEYEKDRLVDTVYNEIDRIEIAERDRMRKENPQWQFNKKGLGIRFLNVAKANDIDTVGDLLNMGRARFEKLRNMGKNCVEEVSQALENLYGIKQW